MPDIDDSAADDRAEAQPDRPLGPFTRVDGGRTETPEDADPIAAHRSVPRERGGRPPREETRDA